MPQVPQLPGPGSHAPSPRDSSRWIDLIAFMAVLALGGALMTLVPASAVSVATVCVALGGLYRLWKRPHASESARPPGDEVNQRRRDAQ